MKLGRTKEDEPPARPGQVVEQRSALIPEPYGVDADGHALIVTRARLFTIGGVGCTECHTCYALVPVDRAVAHDKEMHGITTHEMRIMDRQQQGDDRGGAR